jgi:hypothetical protein
MLVFNMKLLGNKTSINSRTSPAATALFLGNVETRKFTSFAGGTIRVYVRKSECKYNAVLSLRGYVGTT